MLPRGCSTSVAPAQVKYIILVLLVAWILVAKFTLSFSFYALLVQ